MTTKIYMIYIYCDVPGSPCLSKKGIKCTVRLFKKKIVSKELGKMTTKNVHDICIYIIYISFCPRKWSLAGKHLRPPLGSKKLFTTLHIVTCQVHPVLVKSGSNVWSVSFKKIWFWYATTKNNWSFQTILTRRQNCLLGGVLVALIMLDSCSAKIPQNRPYVTLCLIWMCFCTKWP